jgi:hypothetical protein
MNLTSGMMLSPDDQADILVLLQNYKDKTGKKRRRLLAVAAGMVSCSIS